MSPIAWYCDPVTGKIEGFLDGALPPIGWVEAPKPSTGDDRWDPENEQWAYIAPGPAADRTKAFFLALPLAKRTKYWQMYMLGAFALARGDMATVANQINGMQIDDSEDQAIQDGMKQIFGIQ